MVIAVTAKVENVGAVNKLLDKISNPQQVLGDASYELGLVYKKALQRQFILQRKIAPRDKTAAKFDIHRRGNIVTVTVPGSAAHLDSMSPHYVSLKRGRNISKWANDYYSSSYRGGAGRSRVKRGPRGAIVGGALYVQPDPFIKKALNKVRTQDKTVVKRAIRRYLKK